MPMDRNADFDAAVAAAEAELAGDAASVEDGPSTLPNDADVESDDVVVDDAVEIVEAADEEEDLFDFGDEAEDEDLPASDQVPTTVEVEGFGELTPEEIRSGLLMQADYTQKTQQLAEERRQLEADRQALAKQTSSQAELWKSLQDSPKETVAWLASQIGLIDANDAKVKLNEIGGFVLADEATVQAEVQARLDEAVRNHPAVTEAIRQKVVGQIDAQFEQIASRVGKPLSDNAKQKLMDFAYENGIADLTVAYDALSARAGGAKAKRSNAPQPRRAQNAQESAQAPQVDSFDDAVAAAYAELQAQGVVA